MDVAGNQTFINRFWDESILPTLQDYIRIPCKSPNFDSEWLSHGYLHQATELIADWCKKNGPADLKVDVVELKGRTPVIIMELTGDTDETVLLYGHLDKQPEM